MRREFAGAIWDSESGVRLGICKAVFVIGAVNGDVATGAGAVGIGSMCRVDLRVRDCGRRQVTLQADGVDVGKVEELGIVAAVRLMAS